MRRRSDRTGQERSGASGASGASVPPWSWAAENAAGPRAAPAFAHVLAAEFLPREIRVDAVTPGHIKTPAMGVAGTTDEERAEFEEQGGRSTALKRMGTAAEVAAAVLFLAADATFTTNVEFPVDGGFAQGLSGTEH